MISTGVCTNFRLTMSAMLKDFDLFAIHSFNLPLFSRKLLVDNDLTKKFLNDATGIRLLTPEPTLALLSV